MKISCDIIRDLLPLYAEDMVSEDSKHLVDDHLCGCDACVKELAALLGGDWAVSRPLVEKGWTTNDRQVGLSGRTVKPKLIITCGVSGAIQFTACMNGSDHIVAINSDKDAPIFSVAHVAVVGDLYEIVPALIEKLKEAKA